MYAILRDQGKIRIKGQNLHPICILTFEFNLMVTNGFPI